MTSSPTRRHLLAGMAALPLLSACNGTGASSSSSSGSAGRRQVTLGLSYIPDIQFAPFYVAVEKGLFAAAGLDVTLRHHGASEQLTGALQAGTETVLYAGADEMMQARSEGVDVVNFGTVYRRYPVAAISRKESDITTAAQLKGRTIGVPGKYGETWFGLLALLRQGGLSQSDVTIRTIGYTQQAALSTRKVDVVIGYLNNEAVRMRDAGIAVSTIGVKESLISIGLNTLQRTADSSKEVLTGMLTALGQSVDQITKDPAAAVTVSKKYVPTLTSPAQEKAALATLRATLDLIGPGSKVGSQDPAAWTAMAAFMQQSGLLKKPVPAQEAYLTIPR